MVSRRWVWALVVAGATACNSSTKSAGKSEPGATTAPGSAKVPSMTKYQVSVVGEDKPITVEMATPAGWTADVSDVGAPTFGIPNTDVRRMSIAALSLQGDADQRMKTAIGLQWEDTSKLERLDAAGGRIWMVDRGESSIHARMFVPFERGVVMGVAFVKPEGAGKLNEILKAFETIAVVP